MATKKPRFGTVKTTIPAATSKGPGVGLVKVPKRGRPVGKTIKAPTTEAAPSCCPSCGSTEREKYVGTVEHEIAGETPDGRSYTHVVWRRTRCKTCGQVRQDRAYENRPAVKSAA